MSILSKIPRKSRDFEAFFPDLLTKNEKNLDFVNVNKNDKKRKVRDMDDSVSRFFFDHLKALKKGDNVYKWKLEEFAITRIY